MNHPIRRLLHWLHYERREKQPGLTTLQRGYKLPKDARLVDLYQADGSWDWRVKAGRWQIGWSYRNGCIHGPRTGWEQIQWLGQETTALHYRATRWRISWYMPCRFAIHLGWKRYEGAKPC